MTRTVAVIQARMGSSRLPGKVLMPLLGAPVLTRVVDRTRRAKRVDEVVVATTQLPADDAIVQVAHSSGWAVVQGSETDLLERYLDAAAAFDADVVVRITSDCPLIDPELVDMVIAARAESGADYAANNLDPRTYPRGLDVEAFTTAALERAGVEDRSPASREHATPYIYRHPEIFEIFRVASANDASGHRWCVDTPQDFELVSRLYETLGRDDFGWRDALAVLDEHPDWAELNRDVVQKAVPLH